MHRIFHINHQVKSNFKIQKSVLIEFFLKWEVCIIQTETQKIYDVLHW